MKKFILFFSITISCWIGATNLQAQSKVKPPKVRFGKMNKKWLEMTKYAEDSSAAAVVLYDKGNINTLRETAVSGNTVTGEKFRFTFTRHIRIKILKKEGYKYADFKIPFYHPDYATSEKFITLKGYTYSFEGSKVRKDKLKKSAILDKKLNKRWKERTFTFPNVKEGSVVELVYTIQSKYIETLRSWSFQRDIPTMWSIFTLRDHPAFSYRTFLRGYFSYKTISSNRHAMSLFLLSNVPLNTRGKKLSWALRDIPAIRKERYISTLDDYIPRLDFQLLSISGNEFVKERKFMNNWQNTNDQLLQSEYFGTKLRHTAFINGVTKKIKANSQDPIKRATAVYKHLQQHIQWNGLASLYVTNYLKPIYQRKSGNATEINLLLVAMLRKVGLEASPVILSTRSHGKLKPNNPPFLEHFNYTIAEVILGGKKFYADATDPYLPFGMLPHRCLNGVARSIKPPIGEWVLLNNPASATLVNVAMNIQEDGKVVAKAQVIENGLSACFERKVLTKKKDAAYAQSFWKNSEYQIKSYTFENKEDIYKPLKAKYTLESEGENEVKQLGSLIYITPRFHANSSDNPFKTKERQYPIDFGNTFRNNYFFSVNLPKGYKVESLPRQLVISLENKGGRFVYMAKEQQGKIQVIARFSIRKPWFAAVEYPGLKELYNQMIDKLQEQIVLKKL